MRHILFGLQTAGEDDWRRLLDVLDTENVNDQMATLEWAGIVPDAGTRWERLRLGKLKMWLLLALGELDAAFDQLEMVRGSGDMSEAELGELAALHAVLELDAMDPACPTRAHRALLDGYRKVLRGQARSV